MPQCPQCSKPLMSLVRQCPTCRADLDLLVEYVSGLQGNLLRAEQLTRAGELGQAMWAYLEVLEVDPDNSIARRQVSQVATAVRQFDRTAPGRRWAGGYVDAPEGNKLLFWIKGLVLVLVMAFVFSVGLTFGRSFGNDPAPAPPPADPKLDKRPPQLGK